MSQSSFRELQQMMAMYREFQKLESEDLRNKSSFVEFVRTLSIEGLIIDADVVTVLPSTELHKKCGATRISGFSKFEDSCFEISLLNSEDELLSTEEAQAMGLEDQVHTLSKEDLQDFLLKLVSQTK